MTTEVSYTQAPDLGIDDYFVIGLAICFVREDGEIHQVEVIEPIPSAALGALLKGIPTSYKFAYATSLGEVIREDKLQIPPNFPESSEFSEDFIERAFAAARTYKRNEAERLIPLGTTHHEFQFSTERKRVLNATRNVTKDDNVKQHSHTHKVL